ncbi:FkbM family methyltransferase [Variovorax sp. PCZ-1]|uniref:FkbM family methyltransferase n=1 Tax=Variovorax sp. PCZ-1 TaxID=2835533 RepID=UPI001BCF71EB|nr:FkbM family methyltransferase [Variovorax sp. PCZ-1]MBS7807673.1 FkbM family methyltransferase [Variovorax sp. PCZ-1]
MISYSQNFEDVILSRALAKVEAGFYIDIGAQHPVIDSVSKAFYDKGWRGLHIEPTPTYVALLQEARPDETVLQAAVSEKRGSMTFYEIPETGISTGSVDIARGHKERGYESHEIEVPCVTLSSIFTQVAKRKIRDIHWLKIDVEGMELHVLRSWLKHKTRPWIVVVESTLPLTQIENHHLWEHCLIDRGYSPVYFDGLNRYYLVSTHSELAKAFKSGPNVFDDFMLHGTASAPFCRLINEKHEREVQAIRAEILQLTTEAAHREHSLNEQLARVQQQMLEIKAHNNPFPQIKTNDQLI